MKRYFTEHLIENKKGDRFEAKVYRAFSGIVSGGIKVDLFQGDRFIKTIAMSTMQSGYRVIQYSIGKEDM